jgi:hypothetical protein
LLHVFSRIPHRLGKRRLLGAIIEFALDIPLPPGGPGRQQRQAFRDSRDKATEHANELLEAENKYQDYHYLHGFGESF